MPALGFIAISRFLIRIGAVTSLLGHWIQTGKKQNPDELADKVLKMFKRPFEKSKPA